MRPPGMHALARPALAPLSACAQGAAAGAELALEIEDGFKRLVAHGLAKYHSLSSHSRVQPDGGKAVIVRTRGGGEGGAPAAPPAIACADVLCLLLDRPGEGLTQGALREAYLAPFDSASDAPQLSPKPVELEDS